MKANQAFKQADEAVSPVIGVILMVAITVVLAAVVFVLVTRLASNNKDDAPDVGFTTDEAQDRLYVSSADAGLLWSDLEITVNEDNWEVNINAVSGGMATPDATSATSDTFVEFGTIGTAADPVGAGDYLDFCADAGTTSSQVRLIHTETNAALLTRTFATLKTCA